MARKGARRKKPQELLSSPSQFAASISVVSTNRSWISSMLIDIFCYRTLRAVTRQKKQYERPILHATSECRIGLRSSSFETEGHAIRISRVPCWQQKV